MVSGWKWQRGGRAPGMPAAWPSLPWDSQALARKTGDLKTGLGCSGCPHRRPPSLSAGCQAVAGGESRATWMRTGLVGQKARGPQRRCEGPAHLQPRLWSEAFRRHVLAPSRGPPGLAGLCQGTPGSALGWTRQGRLGPCSMALLEHCAPAPSSAERPWLEAGVLAALLSSADRRRPRAPALSCGGDRPEGDLTFLRGCLACGGEARPLCLCAAG